MKLCQIILSGFSVGNICHWIFLLSSGSVDRHDNVVYSYSSHQGWQCVVYVGLFTFR